jgi:DNA-directed RNA polymerase subunit N (RpoN/RPB10)
MEQESQNNIYVSMVDKCSCGHKIGERQREFDMLFDKYKKYMEIDEASINTLKDMNVFRMCCRRHFLRPPIFMIADRNSEKFVDSSNVIGNIIVRPAENLKPGVKLDFPLL